MVNQVPYGKRLKSTRDLTMFVGYPGSDTIKTLPAGKPSPVVDSAIMNNGYRYFQLKPADKNSYNLWLKDTMDLKAVPANAKDESSIFNSWWSWAGDTAENTINAAEKRAGFISDAFGKSVSDLGGGIVGFSGNVRTIILIGASVLVLALIAMIINTVK